MESNQPERTVDVTNFNGTYTLDNLMPYTECRVYVTVGLIDRPQESVQSMTVTNRTLAGGKWQPLIKDILTNLPLYRAYGGGTTQSA